MTIVCADHNLICYTRIQVSCNDAEHCHEDCAHNCSTEIEHCNREALVFWGEHVVDLSVGWTIPHLANEVGNIIRRDGIPKGRLHPKRDQNKRKRNQHSNSRNEGFYSSDPLLKYVTSVSSNHWCRKTTSNDNNGGHVGVIVQIRRISILKETCRQEAKWISSCKPESSSAAEINKAFVCKDNFKLCQERVWCCLNKDTRNSSVTFQLLLHWCWCVLFH